MQVMATALFPAASRRPSIPRSKASVLGLHSRGFYLGLLFLLSLTVAFDSAAADATSPPSTIESPLVGIPTDQLPMAVGNKSTDLGTQQPKTSCSDLLYCLPDKGDVWYQGENNWLQWNNKKIVSSQDSVDIYLFERQNNINTGSLTLTDHRKVLSFKAVDSGTGLRNVTATQIQTVVNGWDGHAVNMNVTGNTDTIRSHFWVVTWADDASVDALQANGIGANFFISGLARPVKAMTTSTPTSTTSAPAPTKTVSTIIQTSPLNGTTIAIISAVSGVVLLGIVIGVVFCVRRRHNNNANELKRDPAVSASSTATMLAITSGKIGQSQTDEAASFENPKSSEGDAPFSSSDARMLAMTFRQILRKPSWQTMSPDSNHADSPSDDDLEKQRQVEEELRRQSEAMLHKELEQDGKGLRTVSVHSVYQDPSLGSPSDRSNTSLRSSSDTLAGFSQPEVLNVQPTSPRDDTSDPRRRRRHTSALGRSTFSAEDMEEATSHTSETPIADPSPPELSFTPTTPRSAKNLIPKDGR